MAKAFRRFGLASASQVPADVVKTAVAPTVSSADAKKFGLENFCNNCYANSVIQALYFCTPFRDLMLQSPDSSLAHIAPQSLPAPPLTPATPLVPVRRKPERKQSTTSASTSVIESVLSPAVPIPPSPPSLFSALRSLFLYISTHPQERGIVSPRAFIDKLKEVNRVFDTTTHQDAHEFLNYLLNKIVEEVEEERKELDAPDDQQNSSVTACLRQFSASEMLCHKNKFFCDSCCDLQEAEKRMKIKRLPNVLALHLKRFKYQEELQRYVKLTYRVAFPFELRLFNTVDEMDDADRLYNLFGIVVHIGNGPHHGHYVSIIKTLGTWLLFDDENVSPVAESEIPKYFGDVAPAAGCAYVLYYQAANIDMGKLGLRPEQADEFRHSAVAELSQPMHPPGLGPEDVVPITVPTPSQSSSLSDLGPPTSAPSLPSPLSPTAPLTEPISIPTLPPSSLHTSISTSASSNHSHTQQRLTERQTQTKPPPAPQLTSSLSSPAPAKPTAGGIFTAIRRSPSISIRTNVGQGSGSNMASPTAATHHVPPLPPTPTRVLVNGAEAMPASPTTLNGSSNGRQQPKPGARPTTVHGHSPSQTGGMPRALPVPSRPTTSGDPGGEREREKEKEGGWGKWFGGRSAEPTALVNGATDGEAVKATGNGGSAEGEMEVDPNTSTSSYLNGSANGVAVGSKKKDKEHKEKGKSGTAWFTGRKSFRLGGDKSPKGGAAPSTPDVEQSAESSTRFRSSLQMPQRRASESGDGQAPGPPPMTGVRSTPGLYEHPQPSGPNYKHRPRPVSTNVKDRSSTHLHPQDYGLANGEVSPTPSSTSSMELGNQSVGFPPYVVPPVAPLSHNKPSAHQTNHTPPRSRHHTKVNGHPPPSQPLPPPPAPRMHSSISTPPSALPSAPPSAPIPKLPVKLTPPQTRPRTLPAVPHPSVPGPPPPERKKSLASFPVFRGREREKDKDPVAPRPSTAGPEVGREKERPLPLPPLPVPDLELRTHHHHHHHQQFPPPLQYPQYQRHGSVLGGPEVEEPADNAPVLGTFSSENTSVNSSASNGGGTGDNGSFKRAKRKLSLTAPMLGFGKRDKDSREKSKDKAAPSSFMRS
ncbi:hypothetical protein H0H87_003305 [Tephrocybe sp. NHM501043]|nr:hypothetical protein H0H87_003305 [Tephrocybe sp. NHM501043]